LGSLATIAIKLCCFLVLLGILVPQQFHAFLALRNRLLGSLAASGNILACPADLAQNDLRLAASFLVFGFGAGAFNPGFPGLARLYEARPLAFNPPLGFLPSERCQAGLLAMIRFRPPKHAALPKLPPRRPRPSPAPAPPTTRLLLPWR